MLGGTYSRRMVAKTFRVSLPTADRWLLAVLRIPGMRKRREGKTSLYEYRSVGRMIQ